MHLRLPYGKSHLDLHLSDALNVTVLLPHSTKPSPDPQGDVKRAVQGYEWSRIVRAPVGSVVIAINDKTRPVPNNLLLPPLLDQLQHLGIEDRHITLIVATGSHPPMTPDEFSLVLPPSIISRYRVISHNAEDLASLITLGTTPRGTPVTINREFAEADLRLVVGCIDPHQFQGFTGGVKGAVIGLAGIDTINANHRWMTHPYAELGRYEDNPARQDIEDMGRMVGVHVALNTILNDDKAIMRVLCGDPLAVMAEAIPMVRSLHQIPVSEPFDLVIASPGGYPKDINVYQAQKALGHAALVTRTQGAIILVAACEEGSGSPKYENWVAGSASPRDVVTRFDAEGFNIGPHKAYQIARDTVNRQVIWVTQHRDLRHLLLETASSLQAALDSVLGSDRSISRVGVMPYASSTIPYLETPVGT